MKRKAHRRHSVDFNEKIFRGWLYKVAGRRIKGTSRGDDIEYKLMGLLMPTFSECEGIALPSLVTLTFIQAFAWLLSEGHIEELAEFFRHYQLAGGTPDALFVADLEGSWTGENYDWQLSLIGLAKYRRYGEQMVLQDLPVFFATDCEFFLGQPWIQRLLTSWYNHGEEQKIRHAFFGTPQRGKRTLLLRRANAFRDLKIFSEVERLLSQQIGHNEAIRQVEKTLEQLDIKDRLSFSAIQKIHRTFDPHKNPFTDLLAFHS